MKIIISPAKKMRMDERLQVKTELPLCLEQSELLLAYLNSLTAEEQKTLWKCNDAIASENRERFLHMNLQQGLTPAILAYEGIQYQYMEPIIFEKEEFDYLQEHLRILSGFYGILRPMDGIALYRLEMQAKVQIDGCRNLYEFWGRRLYDALAPCGEFILNLASKEYSKCIAPYAKERMITCIFAELENGKVVQKGVYAKIARGEMVRYLAEIKGETPGQIKEFHTEGYTFDEKRSDEDTFVFLK